MIGQKGIPSTQGGVEKHVQELAVRLAEFDYDVVAYTRPWYTPKRKTSFQKVRLKSLPTVNSKHLDAITHTFISIVHAAFKEKVDVFHIHAVGPALLAWLPRLLRPQAKVLVTFHCIDRQHQKWGRLARFMLWAGEWSTMKFAHEVIAVSRTLQQYAYEVYKRSVKYVPNGIHQVQNKPASIIKQQFDLEPNSYIVMIARLVRHKGAHYLIEAYNKLETDKKLVIVGGSAFTDDYVEEVNRLAASNDNIIMTGFQSGQALEELFSNAYCYVLPSESEGLPIALLEAASYGRAILASDIPANLEITEQCGLSFENTNVEDLKAKLEYLLAEPEIVEQVGKEARKYVLENYEWNDIVKDTMKIYNALPNKTYKLRTKLAHSNV